MAFALSWNVDGQDLRPFLKDNDYAGLKAHLLKLNPAALLIMDSLPIAVMVKKWLPDCHVIHRNYSSYEGGEWQTRPPQIMVNRWKLEGHKEIIRYLTNEPSFDAATAKTFAAREAETMKLAREAGFTVVALNTSVGSYERQWVQDSKFDTILQAAIKHNHYLGCHEYMTLCLPAALIGDDKLGDKLAMQPENWPRDKITSGYHDYWYLFRHTWLVARCKQLGIGIPSFILTEFGYDNIQNAGNDDIIARLRLEFGMRQYNHDMRGVNTYGRVWDDFYPGLPHNDVIRQQLEWWLEVKPDWIIGACLFGINQDWENPEGHDYSAEARRDFLPVLAEMSVAMAEPKPEPEHHLYTGNDWRRATISAAQGVAYTNKRQFPHRTSEDMGDIRDEQAFDIAFDDGGLLWKRPGGQYMWVALRHIDGGSVFYASKAHVMIDLLIDETKPEPPVEPPPPELPLPFDEAAIEVIVTPIIEREFQKHVEAFYTHVQENEVPKPLRKSAIRILRWIADVLEAHMEAEEGIITASSIAAAAYSTANDSADIREKVAILAHEQWSGWMSYLFSRGTFNDDETWTMPAEFNKRWQRQMNTPYDALSASEQDSDRKEADKFLAVIQPTTSSIAKAVNAAVDDELGAEALTTLNANSIDEPVEAPDEDAA